MYLHEQIVLLLSLTSLQPISALNAMYAKLFCFPFRVHYIHANLITHTGYTLIVVDRRPLDDAQEALGLMGFFLHFFLLYHVY